jgi:Glycosyl hydrolases family 25
MGIQGQDWSNYQSALPDTTGLSFAFVKITQGTSYVNPLWVQQRNHAKANGLVWGGYHFANLEADPIAEADYFLSKVDWVPGDIICLDWEADNDVKSKTQVDDYKNSWLKYVKSKMPNNPVGLYCDKDFWLNYDTNGYDQDFLWIATAGLPAGEPGIKDPWEFHQYSTSGNIDHNYCNLPNTAALRAWALSYNKSEEPMTPADVQLLLNTKVEGAKLPNGYVPTVWEMLNGTKTADTQVANLAAQITALEQQVNGLVNSIPNLITQAVQAAVKETGITATIEVNGTVK